MVTLPTSIETYLNEAGFTPTEILVLKRLLEGEALTLREMAGKTGKSTGVLDQATKRLIERKIMTRENINGTSKYAISSLDAINTWMTKDMEQRHAILDRKRQDFEAFISTVQHESSRPEMEYFEGLFGIQQAFTKLLEMEEREWLLFTPAIMREEDDPLLEFRVDLFRQRHRKKTFMRVISPNVPLGRRYQTRDVYEYRETKLVEPQDFPVAFEQFIVGDTVACIDINQQKASFIHYPELASAQRKIFEMMWCRSGAESAVGAPVRPVEVEIPLMTRYISALRECFLSKSAMGILGILAIVALIITGGMYKYTLELMKDEIGERLMSIAATAAPEINANDLSQLHKAEDMKLPAYQRVYEKLNEIRDNNQGIIYIYTMRPTEEVGIWEFTADGDSNYNIPLYRDDSKNGIFDEADEAVWPGVSYDITGQNIAINGLDRPMYEDEILVDQWGRFISASAPILNEHGNAIGILALDMTVDDLYKKTNDRFKPLLWFFSIILILLMNRIVGLVQHSRMQS